MSLTSVFTATLAQVVHQPTLLLVRVRRFGALHIGVQTTVSAVEHLDALDSGNDVTDFQTVQSRSQILNDVEATSRVVHVRFGRRGRKT